MEHVRPSYGPEQVISTISNELLREANLGEYLDKLIKAYSDSDEFMVVVRLADELQHTFGGIYLKTDPLNSLNFTRGAVVGLRAAELSLSKQSSERLTDMLEHHIFEADYAALELDVKNTNGQNNTRRGRRSYFNLFVREKLLGDFLDKYAQTTEYIPMIEGLLNRFDEIGIEKSGDKKDYASAQMYFAAGFGYVTLAAANAQQPPINQA